MEMITKKGVFLGALLCLLFAMTGIAQPAEGAAEKKLDPRLVELHNENTIVNDRIGQQVFFHHRMDLNYSQKVLAPIGAFRRTADFFFSIDNGKPLLRKIIITTNREGNVDYHDYLFDKSESLDIAYLNDNGSVIAYYFDNGKLISFFNGDDILDESAIKPDSFQAGVAVLNQIEQYKVLFNAMADMLPKTK